MKKQIRKKFPLRVIITSFCLIYTVIFSFSAYGAEPVRIGVLAFRPKPQTVAQWQPLAAALKQAMPERDFVVEALSYSELEESVAKRKVDYILTNPGHYVLLAKRNGLSSPLATLIAFDNGKPTKEFGGVIFCRAEQPTINTLIDIKGKTIALVNTESMGGYQMQAYELSQAGIRLPHDAKLITTEMPHDNVIEAVLSGRADVGFVRSGVLEGMFKEGKLAPKQIKIINLQNQPGFSAKVSTRLYPEWPFVAMPHVDENIARRVAVALFTLEENSVAIRAIGIHGFAIPADYTPVSNILRELRLPPFEAAPAFTLYDVWVQYRWPVIGTLIIIGSILLLSFLLTIANRKLENEKRIVHMQQQKLQESESRFRIMADTAPVLIWITGADKLFTYFNKSWLEFTGRTIEQELGNGWAAGVHPDDVQRCLDIYVNAFDARKSFSMEYRLRRSDNEYRWLIDNGVPRFDAQEVFQGYIGSCVDITERKQAEKALQQSHESLHQILDSMNGLVYVVDMKSYETLYINRYGKEIWGDFTGKVCWQNLQFCQNGPCSFCTTNNLLKQDASSARVHVWEFQNTTTGQWYEGRDSAIVWPDGRMVKMEMATDITGRKMLQIERERLITELQSAVTEVKTLSGIIPICAGCKKIRDDKGYWEQVEAYVSHHTNAQFSHGICPSCVEKFYPEQAERLRNSPKK